MATPPFIPVRDLRFTRVYIVQVALFRNNLVHRAICHSVRHVTKDKWGVYRNLPVNEQADIAYVELDSPGYEQRHHIHTDQLAYFAVEREIPELHLVDPQSEHQLPLGVDNALPDSRTVSEGEDR